MAKPKTVYVCSECGTDSPKWVGRCPSCGAWNSMREMTVRPDSPADATTQRARQALPDAARHEPRPIALSEVSAEEEPRTLTDDHELDRVTGGGIVAGSLTLMGGEPGIGKSTLLLQTALHLTGRKVLYVSGEESERQIKLRADRIQGATAHVVLLCETRLDRVFAHIKNVRPELVVIDSIQTVSVDTVDSSPGSITQIRECAASLLKYAKESGVPVILVGHITKDGTIAGPKVLEHIVDTVLQFEGDRHNFYRILRSIKNRFGSTSELGIYEMRSDGLRPVENPSELLLSPDNAELSGIAIASAIEGVRPFLIETQALVSTAAYGTPQRSATGFDLRRLNMLLAVLEKRVGFKLAQKDVFLNIAGGIRVTDPAIDLSVIASVISSNADRVVPRDICMAGEVGLSGEIRPVTRIGQRVGEAAKLGFSRILIPEGNVKGLEQPTAPIRIIPVSRVEQAMREIFA